MSFSASDFMGGFAGGAGFGMLGGIQNRMGQGVSRFRDPTKPVKHELNKAIKDYERAETFYKKATEEEKKQLSPLLRDMRKELKDQNDKWDKERRKSQLEGRDTFTGRMGFGLEGLRGTDGNILSSIASTKLFLGTITPIFASILENLEAMSSISEETGIFARVISDEYTLMARRSADMVINEETLYTRISERYGLLVNIRRQMGDILSVSDRTLDTLANFPNIIGLSNDETVTLLTTLRSINGQSIEFNTHLIQSMAILGSKNAVAFRDLMDDVQNNAEFFAIYSGDGSDELLKASIYARRLGVDLGMISGVLENFVGIEQSIESQVKLSAMLGHNFDFLRISSQMFHGDTMEGMKSLLDNLRMISDEQMEMPFVKRQLSQELGLSVQELNRLHKSAKDFKDEDILIDMRISKELEDFNETWNQLGFGRIRQHFVRNVISPLSNLLSENQEQMQHFIRGITMLIDVFGSVVQGIAKTSFRIIDSIASMNSTLDNIFGREGVAGRGGAIVATLSSVYLGIQGANLLFNRSLNEQRLQTNLQQIISTKISAIGTRTASTTIAGKGTPWGANVQRRGTGAGTGAVASGAGAGAFAGGSMLRRGAGFAGRGLGIGLGGYLLGQQVYGNLTREGQERKRTTGGATTAGLGGAMSGGLIGSMILPGWGTAIGAGVGGAIGAGSYLIGTDGNNQIQRNKPQTAPARRNYLGDRRSSDISEVNITDEGVEKIAKAMSRVKLESPDVRVFNDDGTRQYYREAGGFA